MAVPPPFSTLSAGTEILVSAVVFYFFFQTQYRAAYRFGIMATALTYEVLFNVTYMAHRLSTTGTPEGPTLPAWAIAFAALHGLLSIVMLLGLIGLVVWAKMERRAGVEDPLGPRTTLVALFLVLWTISVLSGELLYAAQWGQ